MSSPLNSLIFGHIELRLAERVLRVEGQTVALGGRGFDLLQALVLKRDRVVTKDELLDEVWPGLVVEENNLQVQVSGLRRVLGAQAISTVPGIGYRFTLAEGPQALPALAGPPPAQAAGGPSPLAAAAPARLLVADDNRVNRLLLCRALELMGHQVTSAENGRRALELLQAQPFDLLLLDLAMPELDGFAVLEARQAQPALQGAAVIVTSALGGVAPVARCIELGADDFLHKPVDPWLLRARVDSSLARKRQRDEQAETLRRSLPAGPAEAALRPDATVLAARLIGLETTRLAPAPALALLDDWCTLVFDAIQAQGGEVAQFTGDSVVALFDSAPAAQLAAQDMAQLLCPFGVERNAAPESDGRLRSGVGVARGPVLVGHVHAAHRAARACIGVPVARAFALAAASADSGAAYRLDERLLD